MVRTRYATTLLLLLLAGVLARPSSAQGPATANCDPGKAQGDLEINNVFARVFNNGSLFYGNTTTNGDGYLAPQAAQLSPIFASGIWVGGRINGELAVAGSRYDDFDFYPGPLDEATGRPVNPGSCQAYDTIYSVSRVNIANYETGGSDVGDVLDWPVDLGAPVIDGDGVPGNYNLDGGDRPDIIGDQGVFWVMNDVGNAHTARQTGALGIEVQVLAFSFSRADALGNTTFYRYRIINKGPTPIEQTYVSVFSDVDLGDARDDYVGYDDDLGVGFVYNADGNDSGGFNGGYGTAPPALGYDFFQGPIVDGDTLAATAFSYFQNIDSDAVGDPNTGEQIYNFQQGLWGDATPMYALNDGYNYPTAEITKFAFPGNPVTEEFWSEVNRDGNGGDNPTGDRRFAIHTGPFTLQRNDPQDIVFGIVFAQGTDRFSSITAMRAADRLAQTAYDNDFNLAPPPPAPPLCVAGNDLLRPGSGNCLSASTLDGQSTLVWGYPRNSTNYLGRFEVQDVLLDSDAVEDSTYNFEGFNVYRYPNANFDQSQRERVATFDIVNGVTTVVDNLFQPSLGALGPQIVARGTDSGLQYSYQLPNLTNYTDYYYGVSAYSFNEESVPKVIESTPTQITVRPAGLTGGRQLASAAGDSLGSTVINQVGEGSVSARIVDPSAVTGDTYRVVFFAEADGTRNYNIINVTTGETVVDGAAFFAENGRPLDQVNDVIVIDGISFSVVGPPGRLNGIRERNLAQEITDTNLAFSLGSTRPRYFVSAQGINAPADILGRTDWQGGVGERAPTDFQIRFVENPEINGQVILNRQWDGANPDSAFIKGWVVADSAEVVTLDEGDEELERDSLILYNARRIAGAQPRAPFQVWQVNPDGTERQVQAAILDDPVDPVNDPNGPGDLYWSPSLGMATYSLGNSDAVYERIYARDIDYDEAAILADPAANDAAFFSAPTTLGRVLFVAFDATVAPPSPGTVAEFYTTKPNLAGDVFEINSDSLNIADPSLEDQVAALDRIQIVPNPYLGGSTYESGNLSRIARFTNLPEQASVVRIYTVSGTLVKTLRKQGPSRSLDWDLTTENNIPVASGMYLIHIDIDGVGERTLKFGVVQRRTEVDVF